MRKVAFLVASDECPEDTGIPKLRFPRQDAEALSGLLADKETCGFEPQVYLNEPSFKVLEDLYEITNQLTADDILLFYYSGHGYRRGNELCLVSSNSKLSKLIPTSIKATEVLGYLRDSNAKRRILILDCCYSGVIGLQYKAGDTESSLDALANDFGTCILTASTSTQLSEERERDGHGLFTKALIDCLREPPQESINVDDWYHYAVDQLRVAGNQKPTKCGYVEGRPIEVGNFSQRFARLRQQELEHLISIALEKLQPLVENRVFTKEHVESVVCLLERREATLFPHDRTFRENVIRFLKGDTDDFLGVFGKEYDLPERPVKLPAFTGYDIKVPQGLATPPTFNQPNSFQHKDQKCMNSGELLNDRAAVSPAAWPSLISIFTFIRRIIGITLTLLLLVLGIILALSGLLAVTIYKIATGENTSSEIIAAISFIFLGTYMIVAIVEKIIIPWIIDVKKLGSKERFLALLPIISVGATALVVFWYLLY